VVAVNDVRLSSGEASLTVSPGNGGRMTSLRVGDLELLGRGGDGVFEWGCFAMAPYAGRVRRGRLDWRGRHHQLPIALPPHAIHGVTVDRPWTVEADGPTSASLSCGFDARWPWPGRAVAHFRITGDSLDTTLEVHAEREPMPAWIGWHPWFRRRLGRGAPGRLEATAGGVLQRDDDGIPSGEVSAAGPGPWDDCFTDVSWPAAVVWDGVVRLEVDSDARYAVLYDERPDAVCLEPQTGPPDAVALEQHAVVEPGRPLRLTMSWRWSPA
jgi:aldose 1-epimerase